MDSLAQGSQPQGIVARFRSALLPLISVIVFFLALAAIHHLLHEVSYAKLKAELASLNWTQIGLSLAFTAGSFFALIGYDWSALSYLGQRLPLKTVALASSCGYALSNTVGLSLLSGGSVRYRIYLAAGLDGADIARLTLFSTLAMAIGTGLVGAAALLIHPQLLAEFFRLSPALLRGVGMAVLAIAVGLFVVAIVRRSPLRLGSWQIAMPRPATLLLQLAASVIDVGCAAACLYVLIPDAQVPYLAYLVVYALALLAGMVSNVPGGLGVFESVFLVALGRAEPRETLLAALVAYRVVYYLIPLVLAITVLLGREMAERAVLIKAAVSRVQSVSGYIAPTVLSGLTFINGLVLLVSTATPAVPERLERLEGLVPLAIVEVSHILAAVMGIAMLVIARGLLRKLNGAYWLAILASITGSLLSLMKGIDYEESLILAITAAVLAFNRKAFYRRTALLDEPIGWAWISSMLAAVGGMYWIVLFAHKHIEYAHELWWQFEFDAQASRALRAGFAVALSLFLFGIARLLRSPRQRGKLPSKAELDVVETIVRAQDSVDGQLALMGDKYLLFADRQEAFLMYGIRGSHWIALGDPIGRGEAVDELAWRFLEMADRESSRIAFYQTRAETLPLYIDMGLVPYKLGEEAIIVLASFSLEGAKRKGIRQAASRGERDGLTLDIIERDAVPQHWEALSAVSSAWMGSKNTREKRFSLGAFDRDYVCRNGVALVHQNKRLVAFATLMTTDTRAEASIDLMRHVPDSPRTTMEYLFVKLINYFKDQGYQRFTLGMAPMSGMETHPLAPLWHRFGHLIYNRGERFYNFQGLRQFKEKFDPVWEPRYLVAQAGSNPLLVMADVSTLIAGGMQGIFKK